ncbi:hypothetical protein CYY_006306 [Polysphondylium violaceum]|uniref:Tetratricopeptide repeat protein n=1 Tax=Polysphondylium violaceum TaxID=133409 RepID=A0A8J4UZ27_9MYCE|nr:hypothetical protein CYY_006306 [Polysphondylium violaceum]
MNNNDDSTASNINEDSETTTTTTATTAATIKYNSSAFLENKIQSLKTLNIKAKVPIDHQCIQGFSHIPTIRDAIKIKKYQDSLKVSKEDILNELDSLLLNGYHQPNQQQTESIYNSMLIVGVIKSKDAILGLDIDIYKVLNVYSITKGYSLTIPRVLDSISQYQILAHCDIKHFNKTMGTSIDYYDIGDYVRATVLSIDKSNQVVNVSFDFSDLNALFLNEIYRNESLELYKFLGKFDPAELYLQLGFTNIINIIKNDPQFNNPWAINTMSTSFGINQLDSMIPYPSQFINNINSPKFITKFRDTQSFIWAKESIEMGLKCAQEGNFQEAIRYYKEALNVDPKHQTGYVALGAANAKLGNYDKAIHYFETAINLDPNDRNAKKYLDAITDLKYQNYDENNNYDYGNHQQQNEYSSATTADGNYSNSFKDKVKSLIMENEKKRKREREKDKDKDDKSKSSNNNNKRDKYREKKSKRKDKYYDSSSSSDDDSSDSDHEKRKRDSKYKSDRKREKSKERDKYKKEYKESSSRSKYRDQDKSRDQDNRKRDDKYKDSRKR